MLGGDKTSGITFARPGRIGGGGGGGGGGSFDNVAPLPAPVRAASAGAAGGSMPPRKRVEFATPTGATPSAASAATRVPLGTPGASERASATPATAGAGSGAGARGSPAKGGSALQSVSWAREDEREARRKQAREPSPDMKTIDARNAGEFDDKLAQEIASEGLQLDRDWYLREEEGGIDGDEGHALGDEDTYARGKSNQAGQKDQPVRCQRFCVLTMSIRTECWCRRCCCPSVQSDCQCHVCVHQES